MHHLIHCKFTLGERVIPIHENNIYAGTFVTTKSVSERTKRSCLKGRKTIGSLRDIGLKPGVLDPVCCTKVWRHVIIPSVLYGCELWSAIHPNEIEELEKLQRFFARSVQNFHVRSPVAVTTQTLGLWSMEGVIDKSKLLYFGRLCRTSPSQFIKRLLYFRIGQYMCNDVSSTSVIHDLIQTVRKYELDTFLMEYLRTGEFPEKSQWNKIVSRSCLILKI